MNDGWHVFLGQSLQVVLGAILLAAGLAKLRQASRFAAAVRGYQVLIGPVLLRSPAHTDELLDEIERSRALFRITNLVGIFLVAAALVGLLLDGV
jgi:hypothetical protein